MTEDGWYELLRQFASASKVPETAPHTWELLWLYVPDYTLFGKMNDIKRVPFRKENGEFDYEDNTTSSWDWDEDCAGFTVRDEC
jgi:hypothetical protein